MKSRFLAFLLLFLLIPAVFGGIVDQYYDVSTNLTPGGCFIAGCASTSIQSDVSGAETFTAGLSGKLQSVDLFLGNYKGTHPLIVAIYSTPSGDPGGNGVALLGSASVDATMISTNYPGAWNFVDLSAANIFLQNGSRYAIELTCSDVSPIACWLMEFAPYGRGDYYMKTSGSWHLPGGIHYVMGFRTIMDVPGGSAPVISQQPQPQTVVSGTNVTINVTATGSPPISVQWQFNGTNIQGATSFSLLLTNVQSKDGGIYTVTITNALGGVISGPALVTVLAPPTIRIQPMGQAAYWGKFVSFSVAVSGTLPLAYQWFKDGSPIASANGSTLNLTNLDNFAGGNYFVVVSNRVNAATSNPALLIVNAAGISLGLYPGVTIDGVIGKTYGIQSTTNVTPSSAWTTATNITLTQPVELWLDTSVNGISGTVPRRFYRVVAVP